MDLPTTKAEIVKGDAYNLKKEPSTKYTYITTSPDNTFFFKLNFIIATIYLQKRCEKTAPLKLFNID